MGQRLLSTIFIIFLIILAISAQDQPESQPQSASNQTSVQTANKQPSPAEETGKTTDNQTAIQQQPKGEEAAANSEEKQTTEPAPEIPSNAEIQQNSNVPTQQNKEQTAQKQQEQAGEPQPVEAQAPKAESVKNIEGQPEQQKIPQSIGQNHLSNLTEEQKARLLREESIRAQLHANDELSLSKLANLTNQQTLSLEQKLKIQAQAAYQRAREQHLQVQRKNKEELARLIKQQKLSFTQQIVAKQKFKLDQYHAHQNFDSLSFNDFMFDMDPFTEEDFMITIPVSQPMGYQVTVYKNHDGVYLKSVEYDEQQPKRIKIYENHNRVVLESSFYFSDAAIFKADGNSTYTIRFVNSKQHILVIFKLSHVIEANRLEQKATALDIRSHAYRSKQLYMAFTEKFYSLDASLTLQVSNRKKLTSQLTRYSIYTFVEIIIFIVLVLVQVKLIKGLLGSSTIV